MNRFSPANSPLFRLLGALVMGFIFAPILVTVIVSFNSLGFVLPPGAPTLDWYRQALSRPDFIDGIVVSLILGICSAVLGTLIGGLAALALARFRIPGGELVTTLLMSPLLVPSTILGLALYVVLVRVGGGEGFVALLCGHTLFVLPFAVRTLLASLQDVDRSLEEAARMAGAGAVRAFTYVTAPIIKTGIFASLLICFVMSWNDFSITIFLSGKGWIPLPIQIYSYIKFEYDAVGAALVSFIILISFVFIYVLDRVIGISHVFGSENKG